MIFLCYLQKQISQESIARLYWHFSWLLSDPLNPLEHHLKYPRFHLTILKQIILICLKRLISLALYVLPGGIAEVPPTIFKVFKDDGNIL